MTQQEIHKLFKGTFETEVGQKCINYLKEVFVDKPIYKKGQTFEETTFKEGRRDVIQQILKELSNGRS